MRYYPLLFLLVILTTFLTLSIYTILFFPWEFKIGFYLHFLWGILSLVFLTPFCASQSDNRKTIALSYYNPLSDTIFLFLWEFEMVGILCYDSTCSFFIASLCLGQMILMQYCGIHSNVRKSVASKQDTLGTSSLSRYHIQYNSKYEFKKWT